MSHPTLTIDKTTYVLLPREEYQELVAAKAGVTLPSYPKADKRGNRPALEFARASIARSIISERLALGWSQKDLAEASGIAVETISRLETGKHRPQVATVEKIEQALTTARK